MISGTLCCTSISTLPPSWMSVPRPAMLVAMVTAPGRPAWATICGLLVVEAGVQHVVRDAGLLQRLRQLLGLLDRYGTDQHRLLPLRHSSTSLTMARVLSPSVR